MATIINLTRKTVLADKAKMALSFKERLIGLLNRESLYKGEALVIKHASSIHTFFMRFSIDVLFIDRKGKVLKSVSRLKPFRIASTPRFFTDVIELPVGTIFATQTQEGDLLLIKPG